LTSTRAAVVRPGEVARDLTRSRNGGGPKWQQDRLQDTQQEWQQEWRQQTMLPKAVLLSVQELQRGLAIATATPIQVQTPIRCLTAKSLVQCQSTQQQNERTADETK
jgi:hypothetical protein